MKRNPVTVARQINYVFKQFFGKTIFGVIDHINQILNSDNLREFQNKGNA